LDSTPSWGKGCLLSSTRLAERAVILLADLHDLAVRQEDETGFQLTMEELRKTHAAKGAFLRRLAKANL